MASFIAFQVAPVVKNPSANAGDMGSVPGLGRSPGEGNGNLFQYACLGNPMDRGAWQSTVHGVAELDTTEHAAHTPFVEKGVRKWGPSQYRWEESPYLPFRRQMHKIFPDFKWSDKV